MKTALLKPAAQTECIIGWDIGGAHLKAAQLEASGKIRQILQLPCALWQGLDQLTSAFEHACEILGHPTSVHAVTMTGEMADNFSDRIEGVNQITQRVADLFGAERVKIYAGRGGFIAPDKALGATDLIASANWQASVSWVASQLESGLLMDIGSTTTDLIPFHNGALMARGFNDQQRLRHAELVYTGVVRTPLMAMTQQVPVQGEWLALMNEHFATSADIYRILETLPADADQHATADGNDKTPAASRQRLARMLGMDAAELSTQTWFDVARYFEDIQLRTLTDAATRVLSRNQLDREAPIVGAGAGRFLLPALANRLHRDYLDIGKILKNHSVNPDSDAATCMPAAAVALLLHQQSRHSPLP